MLYVFVAPFYKSIRVYWAWNQEFFYFKWCLLSSLFCGVDIFSCFYAIRIWKMWFVSVDVKIDQLSRISSTAYKRASFVDCSPRFVRSDVWTDLAKRLANPSLGLYHGVFTSWFIYRCILEHLLQRKLKLRSIFERTRSIIYVNKWY